jgi:hypothetical protein
MPKRKRLHEPTFWNKDGRYIVPYGHSSFKDLQSENSDIKVIFIKHCTSMSICKALFDPREFENKSDYYIIDEEEMTPEICSKIKKFKIKIKGKEVFWDGINFLHRDTVICDECFKIGILTPKKGCLNHITKCKHKRRTLKSKECEYCFARSFASCWNDIVSQIILKDRTVVNDMLKGSKKIHEFHCKKCDHIFPAHLNTIVKGGWCSFCANQRLCGQENCKTCFEKSFASFDNKKRNCIQTLENLLLIFKHTHSKYDFMCNMCNHLFSHSLSDVAKGTWCPFCANRKLCGQENCKTCFGKSFASVDSKKKNCIQTSKNLLLIFKQSNDKYDFKCFDCAHIFPSTLNHIYQGRWCPFCAGLKLCGQENCGICFEKSFASFDSVKRDCIQTNENLLLIFKKSSQKYDFKCGKCTHLFTPTLNNVSKGCWCRYCYGYICGKEDCLLCEKKCTMGTCFNKARKQTKVTKIWYCEEHFKDCILRNPEETPLLHRAKVSLEIYTLAELQRICMDDDYFYWSNPTNWDCKMIPGLTYKPDNLFCFDKQLKLITYADDLTLNLNQLGYVIIFEVLEEGRKQHSLARSISDKDREHNIRNLLDIYNIPLGCLYASMAHTKHFTAHPDDVFFHKISNGEYEIIPKRMDAFQTRIKEIRDTLTSMFEKKFNGSKWIGH